MTGLIGRKGPILSMSGPHVILEAGYSHSCGKRRWHCRFWPCAFLDAFKLHRLAQCNQMCPLSSMVSRFQQRDPTTQVKHEAWAWTQVLLERGLGALMPR